MTAQTTILIVVAAWLLSLGATLFFVYRSWIKPMQTKFEQQNQLDKASKAMEAQFNSDLVGLHKDLEAHKQLCDTNDTVNAKGIEGHKAETTKIFETITDAFEFINTERTQMIKDLAELKRRVRMTSNETKRNTVERRRS
jgi:hypothetical protein